MTAARAATFLAILALGAAGLVALVSRAPAELRNAKPGPEHYEPELGARFTDEQVARHGAYRRPAYLATLVTILLQVAFLLVLVAGPMRGLVGLAQRVPGGWAVHAAVVGASVAVLGALVALPVGFVRGFVVEHAWGLSTQDVGGWLSDQGRAVAVAAVTAAIAATAFFGIVRWQPRAWWLWCWAAFSVLAALLALLWPVVIAPLFFRFSPLEDADLAARYKALARDAGVAVHHVLVADASRRTTAENAYVAGFGPTKQLVVYDTLLREASDDESAFVVAHELGHQAERHVVKGLAVTSVGLLAGFIALLWLSQQARVWSVAGASGIGDLRAVPVLLLFATVASLLLLPVENAVSRRFESRADEIAVRLTGDAASPVAAFRRLAFANLADLRPPRVAVWVLYTHPPIRDRIGAVVARATAES